MDVSKFIEDNYKEYIDDIQGWVDEQYNKGFKNCFDKVRSIQKQMQSQSRQISDTELEWILTDLPLKLFTLSELLNKVKLEYEVIKLRKKTIKADLDKKAAQMVKDNELAKTEVKSWVDVELTDHDILLSAYSSLITRVDSEISYSRELIMGCKKIWDARKRTEAINPVSEVSSPEEIPPYSSSRQYNQYIRGRYER